MTFASFRHALAVCLGAIAGALSRYYLGLGLVNLFEFEIFPIDTLGVNLLGCFGLGLFVGFTAGHESMSPEIRLMVATGFFGSLTTFSSYELDLAALGDIKGWHQDVLYGLGSPLLGLVCLYGGVALGGARQ